MTKAEERRALLKEQSASMQRSTNVVTNKAQERRKMLGYTQTTPTPTVQSPINNAFSMLNNATKAQSYNDVAKVNNTPVLGYINGKEIAGPIAPSQELVKSTMQNKAYNEYAKKIDAYDFTNTSNNQQIEDKYSWSKWGDVNGNLANKIANTITFGALSGWDKYKAEEENKKNFESTAKDMYDDLLKNKEQRIKEMGEDNYYSLVNRVAPLTDMQGNVLEALGSDVEYGNLQVQSSLAWKDYIDSGKEEDRIKAEQLDEQMKKYMLEHPDVGKTIISDTAQYLPQFGYQAKSNILPTIGSAATYAIANKTTGNKQLAQKASQGVYAVGSTVTGAKASYDLAQGGIYRDLIKMNVPDEKAREISKDSAFWQTVIEAGENIYSLKDIFSVSTSNPVKQRVKDYLKAYGVNIFTEMGEEGSQELIGAVYEKKALDESGLDSSEYTMKNVINRSIKSAYAGGKIALTMGGGETAVNITMNEIPNIQSRAEMQSSKNDIKKSIEQSFDNAIAEAKRKNNNELVAKLQEQKQKSTTSEEINQAYETIKEFSQNTQQPIQNVTSQSPNTQIQQQTNEVIPQATQNQNTANVTQKNANVQNVAQNETQIQQSLGINQENTQVPTEIQTFVDTRNKTSPGLKVEMDSTLNTDGVIIKNADGTRTMKINPKSTRAYEFVALHEMMHDLEGTQEFQELSKFVKNRAITHEQFQQAKQAITQQYQKYYQENNLDMSGLNMDIETTNDMVAQALGNQQFLNELAGNKPNVFMRLYNWIKNVAFDGNKTGKTFAERNADNKYLQELKKKFETAYNTAYKSSSGQQFDIITIQDNKRYTKATRQVIKGNDASKWGEQVEKYINEEIRKGQDVSFYGADGELLTITTDTAGKAKFRNEVTMADGTKRKLTDDEYKAKLEAETHIDELAQISKHKNGPLPDTKNHSFAKDGFNYRNAYFEDSDGKYYKITMSVGKNGEINTIYNVGQMKDAQKNRSNTSNRGLKGPSDKIANGSTTSNNSITPQSKTVKNSTQSSFSLGDLEAFENKKQEAYKKIAKEFGRGATFWEANLEGLEKESAIRMLKRDEGVKNRFIETHDFEKVYKPVNYRALATAETQNFVKDNNVSFKELVKDEELTNKFLDVWGKEFLNVGNSPEIAKQTINMWKDYFEAQKYKYAREEETMRVLKGLESDFEKILSGATQEVDNFETSKKLEKMEAYNKYVESFVNPLYGEKPKLSAEELTELAQDTFGVTTDFSVGAYMTPDGKLLNFRDGRSQYRNDHRDIDAIGYNMQEFIDAGNIRMKPEGNGFELAQEPTDEQYDTLSKYIDSLDGEVYIEIDLGKNKYDGANYRKGTSTSKILSDLQFYFKNGKFPVKSELADFRYSQSNNEWQKYLDKNWDLMPNSNKTYSLPTQAEQQQAQQELRNKLPTEEKQNGEKIAEILNDTEKSKTPFKQLAKEAVNDFKRAFVDAGTDIAEIGKIANDKTLYHMFNSAKQSGQSANYMISEAQTNLQGDKVGKSLIDIFEPIRKKGQDYYKEFEYYMYHLHNIDRMQQGKPVYGKNVTADDSRNIVKEFEAKYPEFTKYAEDIRKWNANLQQFRIDTGLISQEQADIMNEMYPNYVPTYRETNGISGATKSGSIVKIVDTIKKAIGSNKDILPLHEQMARQVMQTVQAGRRNVLGMQLYNDAIKNADKLGEYVQEIKTAKEDIETDADFDFEKQDLEGKFVVYDDGKKVEMQVSEGVLEGLKSLSSAKWESNLLSKGMKKANSTFKKLVTEWNPGFLVKNAVRDIQDAGFYSENAKEFYKNYPQAWKEITSNGELWQKYLAMGGSDASLFDFEQGYVVPKEGIPAKTIQKISEANFLVEQAPRFAEFLRIYNQSDKSYNALMEAMYGAADITVNFGRSGTWGKFINNNLVPFFNPAIQGTSKTLRTITGDGNVQGRKNFAKHMANIVGKGVMLGVAPTMINHILLEVFGGDDYDDLNERDKDMYFLIPTGDGKYFKLPKGRVLSVIGGFARRGLEYAKGNKDAYKGFGEFAVGQTAPTNPFENSLYAPIQAVKNNTTWYGTPIENESLQNYRPSQRYDEGTTEFAKGLGKAINYSPKKIDYLLDAYGGAVADVTMPLMTKKAESSGLGKSFTLDSATSNRLSTDFYDTIEELTYDKNDDDQVAKMQLKYMNDVKEKAQDINKQIKDLHASDLDDKEKLKQIRELRKEVNTLQRDALNTYEKYGELANKYMNDDSVIELALRSTKEDSTEETKQQNIEKTVKLYTDKELFGSEYAMQEYDKRLVEKQKESNLDADTFFEIYFAQKGITGDKNTITGKTQSGSEKKKKLDAMHKAVPKLTPWELNKLYDLLN